MRIIEIKFKNQTKAFGTKISLNLPSQKFNTITNHLSLLMNIQSRKSHNFICIHPSNNCRPYFGIWQRHSECVSTEYLAAKEHASQQRQAEDGILDVDR